MLVDRRGGRWFFGDTHVHSTWSDGALSPASLARRARRLGHDFIVLTDHADGLEGRWPHFARACKDASQLAGVLVVPAYEVTTSASEPMDRSFGDCVELGETDERRLAPNKRLSASDLIARLSFPVVVHPFDRHKPWSCWDVKGVRGIEIMSGSAVAWPESVDRWFEMLPTGCVAMAGTDFHVPIVQQLGRGGGMWVGAETLSAEAVLTGLRTGRSAAAGRGCFGAAHTYAGVSQVMLEHQAAHATCLRVRLFDLCGRLVCQLHRPATAAVVDLPAGVSGGFIACFEFAQGPLGRSETWTNPSAS